MRACGAKLRQPAVLAGKATRILYGAIWVASLPLGLLVACSDASSVSHPAVHAQPDSGGPDDAGAGGPPDAAPAGDADPFDAGAPDAAPVGNADPFDAGASCAESVDFAIIDSVGYNPLRPEAPLRGTVSAVASDNLTISVPNQADISFRWAGPSLISEFSVGDEVSYFMKSAWRVVQSEKITAALLFGFSNTGLPTEAVPGGPTYTLEPQCAEVDSEPICQPVQTLWRMRVDPARASIAIDVGKSAALGPWRLTNLLHNTTSFRRQRPGFPCDPMNYFFVAALGPGASAK